MKKLLQASDYARIEDVVNDLIEDLGLRQFPVNCFEVAFMLGIEIKKYSQFSKTDRDFVVSEYEDGFSITSAGKFIIYYNDSMDRRRNKFTIWHEIAHIQLGHFESDCMISYEQKEMEANHFAAYVMAPLAFIHNLGLCAPSEISDVCEISLACAYKVYGHYKKAFRYESIRNAILNGRIVNLLTYSPKMIGA